MLAPRRLEKCLQGQYDAISAISDGGPGAVSNRENLQRQDRPMVRCFNCGGQGHISTDQVSLHQVPGATCVQLHVVHHLSLHSTSTVDTITPRVPRLLSTIPHSPFARTEVGPEWNFDDDLFTPGRQRVRLTGCQRWACRCKHAAVGTGGPDITVELSAEELK